MSHDRPFVDQRVESFDDAFGAAVTAARSWGLRPPELLRHGMNGIYACGDAVVRVGRATAPASSSHDLADVLADHGVPVAPPLRGCTVDIDGYAVTAWRRIMAVSAPVDWRAVGAAVARIHRLERSEIPADYPVPAPTAFPWWDFDGLLESIADHIDADALRGLRETVDDGRSWAASIARGAVVCHGDVHPGNVLMSADGPVLIDFDLLCCAAPAWDHAMLTTYADRWGGDPGVYAAFATGYGRSFADDELTATLAALRNVAATLMRVRAGLTDEAARAEAERRLRYWKGEPDAPQWRAQ